LRVNFACGAQESEGFVFAGSEGRLEIGHDVILSRVPRERAPGVSIATFTEAMQTRLLEEYRKKYPLEHPGGPAQLREERYVAPPGYHDSYDHLKNFFEAVRSRQPVVEDAVFGYRAAGAALLSNLSLERRKVVRWDPEAMKLL